MSTEPLTPVDAAWFHMDGPANAAVVTSLLTTRHAFDHAAIRRVIAERMAAIGPFHRRVVEHGLSFATPSWEDAADFDLDQHLHFRALPADADDKALLALAEDLASQPLPAGLPLWQMYVVDGPGQRGALVMRYHHCMGDGAAMVGVIRQVFDVEAEAPRAAHPELSGEAFFSLAAPVLQALERGIAGAGALVRDLLKPADPISPFKGRFVMRQRLAWSPALPLASFKEVAADFDAKINDVVVAAVAGALRAYLAERGLAAGQESLRAMVPVNLRTPERARDLGNEFGLVILELPIECASAEERIRATKERMDALKSSSEAVAMRWLFDLFGHGPKSVQQIAQRLFGSKTSLVLTNVAGPAQALSIAGRRVERMMFWVPHPGEDLGMGLSIYSYRGRVALGVIADARRVPDPERIAELFVHEVDAMLRGRTPPA